MDLASSMSLIPITCRSIIYLYPYGFPARDVSHTYYRVCIYVGICTYIRYSGVGKDGYPPPAGYPFQPHDQPPLPVVTVPVVAYVAEPVPPPPSCLDIWYSLSLLFSLNSILKLKLCSYHFIFLDVQFGHSLLLLPPEYVFSSVRPFSLLLTRSQFHSSFDDHR